MLEIKHLKKIYNDRNGAEVVACSLDSLNVSDGEMIGLKGVSGSGKSTFLNMIAGIILPSSGEIVFRGENICAMPENKRDEWRARNVGYIFQTMNLIEQVTALENIMLPAIFAERHMGKNIRAQAFELLDSVGLIREANSKPSELSMGERQRVAVARALISKPSLILADEPTASLDSENASAVMDMLVSRCRESACGLIVASHDSKVLSRFTKIVPMERI